MKKNYLFKSKRLGFRNWVASDLEKMVEINADKKVMEKIGLKRINTFDHPLLLNHSKLKECVLYQFNFS